MIGILDPALFQWGTVGQLSSAEEAALRRILGDVITAVRARGIQLGTTGAYWSALWKDFVVPLQARVSSPQVKALFGELRKLGGATSKFPTPPPQTRVWGFRTMFGATSGLPAGWEDRMGDAVARHVAAGQDVVLFVRLVPGRNLRVWTGKAQVKIHEVTRWRLFVRTPGAPTHQRIDCVRGLEQFQRPWSIRLDPRLPLPADGARYPFCLPVNWHRGSCSVVSTVSSVPAWVDARSRGWTRPNIPQGAGYHWDVFFSNAADVARVGVDQLNIVEYGAPATEGTAGHLHHVPTKKAGKVTDAGWAC